MRDFARIVPTFWTRGTGKLLRKDPTAQVLAFYFMSAPNSGMTGIYYLPRPVMENDTGLSASEIDAALIKFDRLRFAAYDAMSELVWIPNLPRHQVGEAMGGPTDKRHKGFVRELRQLGRHPFVNECVILYAEAYFLPEDLYAESSGRWGWRSENPNASTPSKPKPDQDPNSATPSKGLEGSVALTRARARALAGEEARALALAGGVGDAEDGSPPKSNGEDFSGRTQAGTEELFSSAKGLGERPKGPPSKPPTKLGTQGRSSPSHISLDWKPKPETIERFRAEGYDAESEVEEFVNHWFNKGGSDALKRSWDLAFINRMKQLISFGRAKPWVPPKTPATPAPKRVLTADDHAAADEHSAKILEFLKEAKEASTPPYLRKALETAPKETEGDT
jgi:hypothetical protein